MARYARMISEENTNAEELDRSKVALWRALHEDVTQRQRQYLLLYYGEGLNMSENRRPPGGGQVHGLPYHQAGGGQTAAVPAVRRKTLFAGGTAPVKGRSFETNGGLLTKKLKWVNLRKELTGGKKAVFC